MQVEPAEHFINWQQDPQATTWRGCVFPEPVRECKVTVDLVAEMAVYNPFDFFLEPSAENVPVRVQRLAGARAAPYLACEEPLDAAVRRIPRRAFDGTPRRTIDFLVGLNRQPAATTSAT